MTPIGFAPSGTARSSSRRRGSRRGRRAQAGRFAHERGAPRIVEIAEQEEYSIGAGVARRPQIAGVGEEALREQRQRGGRACRAQVVPRSAETRVYEHGHGCCAGRLVDAPIGRVCVRPQVSCRGRAALELGDCRQARSGQRFPKTSHRPPARSRPAARDALRRRLSRSLACALETLEQIGGVPSGRDRPGCVQQHGVACPPSAPARTSRMAQRSRRACRLKLLGSQRSIPRSRGSTVRSGTSPSDTSQTRFGPAGESSSIPAKPWTTNARRAPSCPAPRRSCAPGPARRRRSAARVLRPDS